MAAIAVALLAYCAHRLWIVTSDFFYHWGVKGKRFYLAQGVDVEYLTQPWNHLVVPWYPTLLPKLYALTALARGAFSEPDMMWWSVLWIVLILVAARELLRVSGIPNGITQAGIACLAAILVTVSLQIRLIGGADWMIAASLMIGGRALIEPSGENDRVAALAAGFAAAAKVEGVVLGLLLLAIYQMRRRVSVGTWNLKAMFRTTAPTIVIVSVWLLQNVRYQLFPDAVAGDPPPLQWYVVAENALEALKPSALHGFGLLLLLLPILFLSRRTRWIGIVAALQLLFYLLVYYASPGDPAVYIRTSFARLVFHLIPTLFTASLLLLGRSSEGAANTFPRSTFRARRPSPATGSTP